MAIVYAKNSRIGSITQKTPSLFRHLFSNDIKLKQKLSSIFSNIILQCDEHMLYKGYRILVVDGSDLRLPTNKTDTDSFIRNDDDTKGYNLVHLDAMYDLMQHIYVDASVQNKKGMNEHRALVSMIDKSSIAEKVLLEDTNRLIILPTFKKKTGIISNVQKKHMA